jgi:hypothetical protein
VSAYTTARASATVAALLLDRARPGVADGTAQRTALEEHIAQPSQRPLQSPLLGELPDHRRRRWRSMWRGLGHVLEDTRYGFRLDRLAHRLAGDE